MGGEQGFDLAAWWSAVMQASLPASTIVLAMRFGGLATNGVLHSHSRQQIAIAIQSDLRAVDRAVRALDALGFLVVERGGGQGYMNRYLFKLPASVEGTPPAQESAKKTETSPANGPPQRAKSNAESTAAAYLARQARVIKTNTVRGVECDQGIDPTVLAVLQPAVAALLDSNGVQVWCRLPRGYREALAVMHGLGCFRESDVAAARDLACELGLPKTDCARHAV